ncbi:DUF6053 domain-containing protein [Lysobacter gummosus]
MRSGPRPSATARPEPRISGCARSFAGGASAPMPFAQVAAIRHF